MRQGRHSVNGDVRDDAPIDKVVAVAAEAVADIASVGKTCAA